MTPTRPAAVIYCPLCVHVGMLPDEITCGRSMRCPKCDGLFSPGIRLQRTCGACGRKRCPWGKIGPATCKRWRPVVTKDEVEQGDLFFG